MCRVSSTMYRSKHVRTLCIANLYSAPFSSNCPKGALQLKEKLKESDKRSSSQRLNKNNVLRARLIDSLFVVCYVLRKCSTRVNEPRRKLFHRKQLFRSFITVVLLPIHGKGVSRSLHQLQLFGMLWVQLPLRPAVSVEI